MEKILEFLFTAVAAPVHMAVRWTNDYFIVVVGTFLLSIILAVVWPKKSKWRPWIVVGVPLAVFWTTCIVYMMYHQGIAGL